MSPAEPKNPAGGAQKVAGGAQKCRWRSPKMSPAEPKNVASRAQKCPKGVVTKILCRRSPTNAGGAGGLFVLIALIWSEVKKYRDSGAIVAVS